ncbi:MAG: sarcosine oxidase subunit gamma [Proteobacteria bacterium]|nr:MAG: sarcosine oxidase subunit gamma [Pseudomonadota bacterium]
MSESSRQSPLFAFEAAQAPAGEPAGVEFMEYPFQGYHNLRCDARELAPAVSDVLGVSFPPPANRFVAADDIVVYWLGPDEWLIRTPSEYDARVVGKLSERLHGERYALTDISSGMTHIAVSGRSAEDVLRQGTPLDLHPRSFGDGCCAQTVLGKTHVLLGRRPEDDGVDVFVRRSFADYLLRFLFDAAHDNGYRFCRAS